MKNLFSRRPSPAMVVALVALFVAMGGTGYAAIKITGKNVKNSSLTGTDIKNSSLTGKDVKNSGLTGSDIKNNSLTGSDVAESSLGKVSSASRADTATTAGSAGSAGNANTVGGHRIVPFSFRSDTGNVSHPIASVGGAEIRAGCTSSDPDLSLKNVSGSVVEANRAAVFQAANTTNSDRNPALANNSAFDLSPSGAAEDGASGQASFVTASGRVLRVLYTLNRNVDGFDCSINGMAIG